MNDQWVAHRSGFVCGSVGVFPIDGGIWVVWERVDGVWREALPFIAAGPEGQTGPRGGPPMFEVSKRTASEALEAAKGLALELRASRMN